MKEQLKIQIIGTFLAIMTAVGCIAYEKIVKMNGYFWVGAFSMIAYLPFVFIFGIIEKSKFNPDTSKFWILIYLISGCTGPLWWYLTKTKTVMVGAVFEVKYIIILGLFSIAIGDKGVTGWTVLGAACAIASIYFISK